MSSAILKTLSSREKLFTFSFLKKNYMIGFSGSCFQMDVMKPENLYRIKDILWSLKKKIGKKLCHENSNE